MVSGDGMYNQMATAYQTIFPVDEDTLRFVSQTFKKGRILDLACGTGGYAIALAKRGFDVEGVDLANEMIQSAIEAANHEAVNAAFRVADMIEILPANRYDGVLFIGNSLVHAASLADAAKILNNVYQSLRPGGKLVLQIVNYDRIMKSRPSELPKIERDGVVFERRYLYEPLHIRFQTVLTFEGQCVTDEVRLLPIFSNTLKDLLIAAGFSDVELRDDFTAAPFDANATFALVVVARKERI